MNIRKAIAISGIALIALSITPSIGCSQPDTAMNPVRYLMILPSPQCLPPGGFIYSTEVILPFPTDIRVAYPGEYINLILIPDGSFKGDVTAFKYKMFNQGSSKETDVNFPPDAGTGGIPSYFFAPTDSGSFALRIYFEGKVVAAASLEVG